MCLLAEIPQQKYYNTIPQHSERPPWALFLCRNSFQLITSQTGFSVIILVGTINFQGWGEAGMGWRHEAGIPNREENCGGGLVQDWRHRRGGRGWNGRQIWRALASAVKGGAKGKVDNDFGSEEGPFNSSGKGMRWMRWENTHGEGGGGRGRGTIGES